MYVVISSTPTYPKVNVNTIGYLICLINMFLLNLGKVMRRNYFYQSHLKYFTKDELSFCNTKIIQRYRIGIKFGLDYLFKKVLRILPNFNKVRLWILTKKNSLKQGKFVFQWKCKQSVFPGAKISSQKRD